MNNSEATERSSEVKLSIDVGIANLGIAVYTETNKKIDKLLQLTTYKTTNEKSIQNRLVDITDYIKKLIKTYNVQEIIYERPVFTGSKKNAEKVNYVVGNLYLLAGVLKIPIYDINPNTVKKVLTGNGKAKKPDILKGVIQISSTINLNGHVLSKADDHAIDALAIGYTHTLNSL